MKKWVLGYWLSVNEDLFIFPTFTQNYTWTKDPTEGSPNNESISFGTVEGMSVNSDIGITYRIDPTMVHNVFQKYKRGVDEITDTFLRNMVRDALVEAASTLEIESIYGSGKAKLMDTVEKNVREQVAPIGILLRKFTGSVGYGFLNQSMHPLMPNLQLTKWLSNEEMKSLKLKQRPIKPFKRLVV